MSMYYECFVSFCLIVGTTIAENITLQIPKYSVKNDNIFAQCSAEEQPFSNLVEFLLNGKTLDSLRRRSDGCFSAAYNIYCHPDYCWCDETGTNYRLRINMKKTGVMNITCSMAFGVYDLQFVRKTDVTHVMDVEGPYVTVEKGYPLEIGRNLEILCSVETMLNVHLEWDCPFGEIGNISSMNKTKEIKLEIYFSSDILGKTCLCKMRHRSVKKTTIFVFNETNSGEHAKQSFDYDKFILAITSLGVFVITVGTIDVLIVLKGGNVLNKRSEIVQHARPDQSEYHQASTEVSGHVYSYPMEGYLESVNTNSNGYEEIQDIFNENFGLSLNGKDLEQVDLANPYLEVIP